MIGGLIQQLCLGSDQVEEVVSLVRRPSGVEHTKLTEVIVDDFLNLNKEADYLNDIDMVFYCLGVYTGAVDRELFHQITVTYPKVLAETLINNNTHPRFCLLSGDGADRSGKSRFIFAKDKGEIESILSNMGFYAFHAFRPGYIYPVTPRVEPNFSYQLSRWLYPVIRLIGKNASVKSTELAQAMFNVGLQGHKLEVLRNRHIVTLVN